MWGLRVWVGKYGLFVGPAADVAAARSAADVPGVDAAVEVAAVDAPAHIPTPEVMVRSRLSSHHLWAAKHFSRLCSERESELATAEESNFDIEHRSYVLACIASAVAFLEGAVNEVLHHAADGQHLHEDAYIAPLGLPVIFEFATYWKKIGDGRKPTLRKYQKALKLAEATKFDEGGDPFQDVQRLIRLSDRVIHFRSRSANIADEKKWEEGLEGRFEMNRLMAGAGNPRFPDHYLGAGCAAWACRVVETFVDDFASRLGISLNYQRNIGVWPPP